MEPIWVAPNWADSSWLVLFITIKPRGQKILLNRGDRKVEFWANEIGVKLIDFEYKNNKDPFFNINTEEELETAKKLLKDD